MAVAPCEKAGVLCWYEDSQLESNFCSLPEEMIEKVLRHLGRVTDLYHAALTCRKIYRITGGSRLWIEQRQACERAFSNNFPPNAIPDPSAWQKNSWLAMRIYRQRFLLLFSQKYSPKEIAAIRLNSDPSSIQTYAVKNEWQFWMDRNVRSGSLTIPFNFEFTERTFDLFLDALKGREGVVKLELYCPLTRALAVKLAKFIQAEGGGIRSLTICPSYRSASFDTTEEVMKLLCLIPTLTRLVLSHLPYTAKHLHQLATATESMRQLQQLHLNFRYQTLSVEEWTEVGRLFRNTSLNHLWIEGMSDFGLQCVGSSLLETVIPNICFRSGMLSNCSEPLLTHFVLTNSNVKLLDIASNIHLQYEEVPQLAAAVNDRPELSFGISGSRIFTSSSTAMPQNRRGRVPFKFH